MLITNLKKLSTVVIACVISCCYVNRFDLFLLFSTFNKPLKHRQYMETLSKPIVSKIERETPSRQ